MPGLCGCEAPSFDGSLDDHIPWYCTNCGTFVPEDEELPDPSIQDGMKKQTAQRTSLNLSWPPGNKYIDDDDETAKCVISILESIKHSPDQKSILLPLDDEISEEKAVSNERNTENIEWGDKLYPYQPLHQAQHQGNGSHFRVLKLSPGGRKDPLHGTLMVEALKSAPEYEAVSYTWADENGDSSRRRPLYLGEPWYRLAITNSCEAALRRFRDVEKPRNLWVDTICINQGDVDERRQQVGLMPEIYSRARKALVYLGRGSESTRMAMFALNLDEQSSELYRNDSWSRSSIKKFFSLPYFTRIWIIQELALAKEVQFFHAYDYQSLELHHARERVQRMFKKTAGQAVLPLWLQHCGRRKLHSWHEFISLIFDGSSSRASLPEDKIFAFFGMIDGAEDEGLVADYNLSVEQVYTGISAFLVSKGYLIDILKRANGIASQKAIQDPPIIDLPSWVPDFRRETMWDRLKPKSGFLPVYILPNSSSPPERSEYEHVLKQTGSLVVYGHRLTGTLINQPMTEPYHQYPSEEASIMFCKPFNPTTDIILIPCLKEPQPYSLHLRTAFSPNPANCYTFVGLCKVCMVNPAGNQDDKIALYGNWFTIKSGDPRQRIGHGALAFSRLLMHNTHLISALVFPPLPIEISGLDFAGTHYYEQDSDEEMRSLAKFFASAQYNDEKGLRAKGKIIRLLETICRCDLKYIPPHYDKLWTQWKKDRKSTVSSLGQFMIPSSKSQLDQYAAEKTHSAILQWQISTGKLIEKTSLSQDYTSLFVTRPRVIQAGANRDLLNPHDCNKIFEEMHNYVVRWIEFHRRSDGSFFLRDDRFEEDKWPTVWSLIGDWREFTDVMSQVPRGGTITYEKKSIFRQVIAGNLFMFPVWNPIKERVVII
ncbi:heterokaryon incompatibility protein-domain-containing protein [Hypomontagnella monticulosa]|nr:heterokaryon incompatibility protein-domain-containing protein [Hypomontagnella monticulosa]